MAQIGLSAWKRGIQPLVPDHVRDRILRDNPFRPFIQLSGPNVLVAEFEGQPASIAACEDGDNEITDLWVDPAYEGLGIGSALLTRLEEQIRNRGYDTASISVASKNERALALYLHRGFAVAWQEPRFDPILQIRLEKTGLSKKFIGG
ncbi:N-acetyltransferase [Roseibium sp. RKSG952]|uniref:GNAT family N-acetyltransferase n=1 Tax=Roseibium sp. RKSG952 TaxID=2529384 RepID=UPI0012BBDF39|nr:GNAT family N-acetyltransferase [Roseibium sp. RKSG952]